MESKKLSPNDELALGALTGATSEDTKLAAKYAGRYVVRIRYERGMEFKGKELVKYAGFKPGKRLPGITCFAQSTDFSKADAEALHGLLAETLKGVIVEVVPWMVAREESKRWA